MPLTDARTNIDMQCNDISSAIGFYTGELGFQIDKIFPADAPRLATLSGHGINIRLHCKNAGEGVSPPVGLPALVPGFHLHRAGDSEWGDGRAGMQYRDLIPGRLGGRYIASHIRISGGGAVPDYVHYHDIGFQLVYCYKGWVEVAYEDQGAALRMVPGDCVLQPPHIRHRVLACSDGMEVVEVSCPAEHVTFADYTMTLPTAKCNPARDYHGQRFVFHQQEKTPWAPARIDGFETINAVIGTATNDLVNVDTIRPFSGTQHAELFFETELNFCFVLQGAATIQINQQSPESAGCGDAIVIPARDSVSLTDMSADLRILLVTASPN